MQGVTPGYEPFAKTPRPGGAGTIEGDGGMGPDQTGDGAATTDPNAAQDQAAGDQTAQDQGPGDQADDTGGNDFANDLATDTSGFNSALASLGATAGAFSAAPTMQGDLYGGAVVTLEGRFPRVFSHHVPGTILNGQPPGSSAALLGFDFGGGLPDDVFTSGSGYATPNSPVINQFGILEPLPPSDAPQSPGAGFTFDGGTATYLPTDPNNPTPFASGDTFLVDYSYSAPFGSEGAPAVRLAAPDVATRRVKLSENYSPEVRNRCFMNYNFFNDTFGGLGDISRWVLGVEHILVEDLVSVEVRQPMAGTFSSNQDINGSRNRSFELGNMTVLGKFVLHRRGEFIWTAGSGITIPLADDSRLMRGDQTLLLIENEAVHFLPFTSVLFRTGPDTVIQAYMQYDFALNGDPIRGDLTGALPLIGKYTDSNLIHLDTSLHQTAYRGSRTSFLNQIIANFELHYTGTLQDSDFVAANGFAVRGLASNFNILNGTVGAHFVLNNNLVVTPGMSVPLRDGTDEQFDYEALVQVNYFH
jgi:hypothetical protein